MVMKIFTPKKFSENIAVFCSNYCLFFHKFYQIIHFCEKRQFFPPIIGKIVTVTTAPGWGVNPRSFDFLLIFPSLYLPPSQSGSP
jgi:hypothetical protein